MNGLALTFVSLLMNQVPAQMVRVKFQSLQCSQHSDRERGGREGGRGGRKSVNETFCVFYNVPFSVLHSRVHPNIKIQ